MKCDKCKAEMVEGQPHACPTLFDYPIVFVDELPPARTRGDSDEVARDPSVYWWEEDGCITP